MALNPIIVAINQSGMATARRVADALGCPVHGRVDRVDGTDVEFENALDHVRDLFAAGHAVVGVCAAGILIRAVAPLLSDKRAEPPVLAVADDGSTVVPLLGGHQGGNRLAGQIADALGVRAALTTAGDVGLGLALDEPPQGWAVSHPKAAKPVMAKALTEGLSFEGDEAHRVTWAESQKGGAVVPVALAPVDGFALHPKRATIGVGAARNCPSDELAALVADALAEAGIAPAACNGVFSIDLKANEVAITALAASLNLPFRTFDAERLEAEAPRLANPSDVVFAEVGCHGVAEGAALAAAGADAELVVPKKKSANATVAIALAPEPIMELAGDQRGRVSLVGIGPGQAAWRTPEASRLIADADELVGYGLYIDLLGPLAAGKPRADFPLGGEEARCRYALEEAGKGRNIALICSGDAGIYAMGALVFELLDRDADTGVSDAARRVDVVSAPGISALQGAAARSGAPLGHDFCAISLSDLLTPRDDILRRLKAAAEGDFVVAFYNPVSKTRRTLLAEGRDILLQHRPADTPVLLARSLGRPEEELVYRRLDALDVDEVDMLTVVLVGSSNSRLGDWGAGPKFYTPRGYARKIDGDLS